MSSLSRDGRRWVFRRPATEATAMQYDKCRDPDDGTEGTSNNIRIAVTVTTGRPHVRPRSRPIPPRSAGPSNPTTASMNTGKR
jgi:hypothetical protein